jgi:hypothetical protein
MAPAPARTSKATKPGPGRQSKGKGIPTATKKSPRKESPRRESPRRVGAAARTMKGNWETKRRRKRNLLNTPPSVLITATGPTHLTVCSKQRYFFPQQPSFQGLREVLLEDLRGERDCTRRNLHYDKEVCPSWKVPAKRAQPGEKLLPPCFVIGHHVVLCLLPCKWTPVLIMFTNLALLCSKEVHRRAG